ncbi:hypothetical protein A6U87_23715 [Rhizobium sp. AC44/96]|jgi:hypothetical protein|uniref:hypothetical protein n=1 Tax=unclassified Rhizobium TaxID=2613769 RepID=UPI00080F88B2|nr:MULTISPECIES: hypothetical protein [unclassified Rhizobium]MDM9619419.1 hypothetical protein [Rhizobium sp. S96]OCJ15149.1 hypothetical protein A6U87_23715 [Rhizobium sp. AC44/96]
MIALIGAGLGFATAPLRSMFAMAFVGCMICVSYACAAIFSSSVSVLHLIAAIICYNVGLLVALVGLHSIELARKQTRFS